MSAPSDAAGVSHRVPLGQKVAFGMGMLGNQMFPAAMAVFLVVLVESLEMSPFWVGLVVFLPRLTDAITDPVMGFITDNTKSRWGRRRPYILIGALLTGLAYAFMWQLYEGNGEAFNLVYFLIWSLVYFLGLTIFATPFVAMGYEMSDDFHERTRLMAVSQWIGQWAWIIVPWFWVILYDPFFFPSEEDPNRADAVAGARELAIWVAVGCTLLAMTPAFFCKTQPVDRDRLEDLSVANLRKNLGSLFAGFGATFRCRPFVRLCLATFFIFNAFNTVAQFSYFIIVHYMNGGDNGAAGLWPSMVGSATSLASAFLAIPAVAWLDRKVGKRKAFLISQSLAIPGYLATWWCFNPEQPWMMFLPLPLFCFGIGSLFTLMMSMTADVCDLDELNTGDRREGAFGAVYWWMVKVGFAFSALVGGLIFWIVGFDEKAGSQTAEAMTGMRIAYIVVPIAGTLAAMWIMLAYDVDEARADDIRRQLAERKAGEGVAEGDAAAVG